MTYKTLLGTLAVAALPVLCQSCGKGTNHGLTAQESALLSSVDPFIGTGGHGHTYPGFMKPFGMITPGPDTRIYEWDACSGYYNSDNRLNGFTQTHLSGTGCADYGDFLLMPIVGTPDLSYQGWDKQNTKYASPFDKSSEHAEPGYYTVFLDRYGVKAEGTATDRAALYRFTYPASDSAGILIDMDYSIGRQRNRVMTVNIIDSVTIEGHKNTSFWAWDQDLYFYAKFSKPFSSTIITDTISNPDPNGNPQEPWVLKKVLLHFNTTKDEPVMVKIAVSAVDEAGAKGNLTAEIPQWDFDRVKHDNQKAWTKYLSKIDVETPNDSLKKIFYTGLFHTAFAPNLFSDTDGRYRKMNREIGQNAPNDPMYTVFSLWDTYRAYHPMMTIIDPKLNNQFIKTLIRQYEDGGILPMWELAGNYTGCMIGYHAVPVIVDAYMKGDRDFDAGKALEACIHSASYDTTAFIATTRYLRDAALMPISKMYKNALGYIPCDKENESVSKGLEYAYNDWCISTFAKALGKEEAADALRGQNYRNYWDPSTRFMRPKDSHGVWRKDFDPSGFAAKVRDYTEGTAWQYTWYVPQDIPGLVSLMGGNEAFANKLDSLFIVSSAVEGHDVPPDISGMIGQYAQGNEPSQQIIHLYNYVGKPFKTQEMLDQVIKTQYAAQPDGISGNEDCGQMSAWFILNTMGFYQVCPGNPTYSIGRPMFDHVTIHLDNGKTFEIKTINNSPDHKYIQSARLNGQPLYVPFFTHDEIMAGGTLEIEMTDTPTQWGTK